MKEGDKLVTVVRKDFDSGYKTAQSVHAMANFAVEHPDEFKAWQHGSNYVCCLEASPNRLDYLIEVISSTGAKFTIFREPDIGNEISSIAVEPLPEAEHKNLFGKLKLSK